jgi:hypothetical protein
VYVGGDQVLIGEIFGMAEDESKLIAIESLKY